MPYLSALEVCLRHGAIQTHVYFTYLTVMISIAPVRLSVMLYLLKASTCRKSTFAFFRVGYLGQFHISSLPSHGEGHRSKGVSVRPVRALNFKCFDLERSFLVCMYVFRISRSRSYTKVIGSRSLGQKRVRVVCNHRGSTARK